MDYEGEHSPPVHNEIIYVCIWIRKWKELILSSAGYSVCCSVHQNNKANYISRQHRPTTTVSSVQFVLADMDQCRPSWELTFPEGHKRMNCVALTASAHPLCYPLCRIVYRDLPICHKSFHTYIHLLTPSDSQCESTGNIDSAI